MEEQDKDLFQKIGVDIGNDKINIDLTQTRSFLNTLQKKFEGAAENLEKDISEGKVDLADNVGIKVDQDNINIDLKKTKSFIEEFGKKVENFLGEIDKAVENIDKK